jgi:hypothetical protein
MPRLVAPQVFSACRRFGMGLLLRVQEAPMSRRLSCIPPHRNSMMALDAVTRITLQVTDHWQLQGRRRGAGGSPCQR